MALWTAALEGSDPLAATALDRFFLSLGAFAGDLALAHGANAVVLAGGLGYRLRDRFATSGFADRFIAKGRFEQRMQAIPVKVFEPPPARPLWCGCSLREGVSMTIDAIMRMAPVIPVLVIDETLDPVALAETLVEAGLPVIEVTLRTPGALAAMQAMAQVEGAVVGAGTVLNERMLGESIEAGARFIVSPGLTEPLGRAAIASGVPYLPGVANAGDIMRGLDLGLDRFKLFPAEAAGGLASVEGACRALRRGAFLPDRRHPP